MIKKFLLVFCILILIWYTLIYFCYPKIDINNKGVININEINIDSLETGDLIFFSGTTLGEKAIRFYSQSCWSHVGVILKDSFDNSEPSKESCYIWEFDHDGPHLRLLKDKLERWKGEKYVGVLRVYPEITRQDIYENIDKYKDKEFDSSMVKWLIPYFENDKVFCSEMIADLLKLPGRKSSYSPGKIFDEINKF